MKRRYLLDTGPAFDYLFKRKGVDERVTEVRLAGAKVGICLPVLGEIVGGLEASDSRESSWKTARPRLTRLICWPYEKLAAYEYGRIFADLKKRGRVIQQIDIMIAAVALTMSDCAVVSADSDLTEVRGLVVENWTA